MNKRKSKDEDIDINIIMTFANDEERRKFDELPQLEREQIYHEKYLEYQQRLDREKLLSDSGIGGNRKKAAIEEIKQKRIEVANKANKAEEYESGEIEESENQADDSSLLEVNDLNNEIQDEFILSCAELEKVRVSRLLFEKYHSHKYFQLAFKGAYVKLNLGGGGQKKQALSYMIAEIKDIFSVQEEPYKINEATYNTYFTAKHGESEKKFAFSFVSNSNFEEFEFTKWKQRLSKAGIPLPDRITVNQKEQDIEKMKNYVYSHEEKLKTINDNRYLKIKNRDKTLNVTLERAEIEEHYEACKMKIKDLKDDYGNCKTEKEKRETETAISKFKSEYLRLEECLEILKDMQEQRLNESKAISQNVLAFKINQKNLENQKLIDNQNRLLNKKRVQDEYNPDANPYRRRECNPMSLFSSNRKNDDTAVVNRIELGNIKMTKIDEDSYIGTPKELYDRRRADLKKNEAIFEKFEKNFSTKEEELINRLVETTNAIQATKKGYYGLLESAKIDIGNYIYYNNQKLLAKYKIEDPRTIKELEFI